MMGKKILQLRFKKAKILAQMESLSIVNDDLYLELGKISAAIMLLEKKELRKIVNPLSQ